MTSIRYGPRRRRSASAGWAHCRNPGRCAVRRGGAGGARLRPGSDDRRSAASGEPRGCGLRRRRRAAGGRRPRWRRRAADGRGAVPRLPSRPGAGIGPGAAGTLRHRAAAGSKIWRIVLGRNGRTCRCGRAASSAIRPGGCEGARPNWASGGVYPRRGDENRRDKPGGSPVREIVSKPRNHPLAFVLTVGSSATLTQTWTCGWPRKYQTNAGPSSRQLSHSPSSPMSPSL